MKSGSGWRGICWSRVLRSCSGRFGRLGDRWCTGDRATVSRTLRQGMTMFVEAIVRGVPETLHAGITSADLGKPHHANAVAQHLRYIRALEECGLEVTALDADEKYPDSVFIEDTAVVTARCAILARPGAESRRAEVHGVEEVLSGRYENIERIIDPGTLDGGDVLQAGDHFYIGLTSRTNLEG